MLTIGIKGASESVRRLYAIHLRKHLVSSGHSVALVERLSSGVSLVVDVLIVYSAVGRECEKLVHLHDSERSVIWHTSTFNDYDEDSRSFVEAIGCSFTP